MKRRKEELAQGMVVAGKVGRKKVFKKGNLHEDDRCVRNDAHTVDKRRASVGVSGQSGRRSRR